MSTRLWFHLLMAATWLLLSHYCSRHSYTDPSSVWYNKKRAYEPLYSTQREEDAKRYISEFQQYPTTTATKDVVHQSEDESRADEICIGIPSKRRVKEQFLPTTLGSLLDSISSEDRSRLYIVVLLAEDKPANHPSFGQPWLEQLADEILLYGNPPRRTRAKSYREIAPVVSKQRNTHVRHDYAAIAEACRRRGSSTFLLAEDDIVASADWLQQLQRAISQAEGEKSNHANDWFYLRLFYTETYLGWNNEEILLYIKNIVLVMLVVFLLSLAVEHAWLGTNAARRRFSMKRHGQSFWPVYLWTGAFIALYFMAGRLMVNPYPLGVHEMPKYGCCAQGLAFPERHLDTLIDSLKQSTLDMVNIAGDSCVDSIAERLSLRKLAIVPSVFQHIGRRTSSAVGARSKNSWNFSFERLAR